MFFIILKTPKIPYWPTARKADPQLKQASKEGGYGRTQQRIADPTHGADQTGDLEKFINKRKNIFINFPENFNIFLRGILFGQKVPKLYICQGNFLQPS